MKITKCPICSSKVDVIQKEYKSNKLDIITNEQIIVPNIKIFVCTNEECQHTWLPNVEEEKIDLAIKKRTRHSLTPEQIKSHL